MVDKMAKFAFKLLCIFMLIFVAKNSIAQDIIQSTQIPLSTNALEEVKNINLQQTLLNFKSRISNIVIGYQNIDLLLDNFVVFTLRLDEQEIHNLRLFILIYITIFILVGFSLEWAYRRYISIPFLEKLNAKSSANTIDILKNLGANFLLIIGGIVVFGTGFYVSNHILIPQEHFKQTYFSTTLHNVMVFIILYRFILAITFIFISPDKKSWRMIPISNDRARQIAWRAQVLLLIAIVGDFLFVNVMSLGGSEALSNVIDSTVILSVTTVFILFIWSDYFLPLKKVYNNKEPMSLGYAIYGTIIMLCVSFFWIIQFYFVSWLFFFAYFLPKILSTSKATISYIIHKSFLALLDSNIIKESSNNLEKYQWLDDEKLIIYLPFIQNLVRNTLLFIIFCFLVIVLVWDLDTLIQFTLNPDIAQQVIILIFILYLSNIFWMWIKTFIDEKIYQTPMSEPGKEQSSDIRLLTLLPLIKKVIFVFLATLVIMITLSSLGLDIAPLLASAGVVGVAVGFGSQKLVQDIISGVFFLVDDAFRLGEYIEMGEIRGTVEAISIRSLRLRHHKGAIHTIPYSTLDTITNYSRDWVILKLEFRVPFEADLKLIKKLIKNLGKEMLENPEYGQHFLEPLKSQGRSQDGRI